MSENTAPWASWWFRAEGGLQVKHFDSNLAAFVRMLGTDSYAATVWSEGQNDGRREEGFSTLEEARDWAEAQPELAETLSKYREGRTSLWNYSGAAVEAWVREDEGGVVCTLYSFYDDMEEGDEIIAMRLRPPQPSDVRFCEETLYETLEGTVEDCNEHLRWDEGGPNMPSQKNIPDEAWRAWVTATEHFVQVICDLDEAAWPPTGERVLLYWDGTVKRLPEKTDE